MKKKISDLEHLIDFLNAQALFTIPEKQERAKIIIGRRLKEYFALTGKHYIPDIQRRKYQEGDY